MKAIQNLAESIEIPHLLLSVIFVGVGLLFSYLLGVVTTLECTRAGTAQSCHLQNSWLGLVTLNDRQLEAVHEAWVEESCDDDGCTYRVALQTSQGQLPLGSAYSSGEASKQEKARLVNAYVKDPSIASLKVQEGGGFWMVIPLIFVVVGVWLVAKPILKPAFQKKEE